MGAADVVGLDLQARDRVGPGGLGEDEVVVFLIGIGALGVLLDADHPFPDDPRLILEAGLVEKVTPGMRRLVVLPGEVGEVLPPRGEHDAVDLGSRPFPGQRDLLVDLRQPRPEAADRPLQRGVGTDQGPFPAEVPGGVVPVLDVDEPQFRPAPDEDFHGPDVQARRIAALAPGGLADEGRLGPLFEHDERVVHVHRPRAGERDEAEQRGLHLDPLGHIEQRPARPEGRMQGREGVGTGRDGVGEEVAFEQFRVLLDRRGQVEEHRPAELAGVGLPGDVRVDLLDPRRVVAAERLPERFQGRLLFGSGLDARRRREGMRLERPDIGAPPLLIFRSRPGERLEEAERLPPALDEPGWLLASLEESVEGRLGETARRGRCDCGCATHYGVALLYIFRVNV